MDGSWKTCYHSPDYYISDTGQVFNNLLGGVIPTQINEDGHHKVTLRLGVSFRKTFSLHRLVAECFILNCEGKETVNHIDGDKGNNSSTNLEWATRSEQTQHAWDNGLIRDLETRKNKTRQKTR